MKKQIKAIILAIMAFLLLDLIVNQIDEKEAQVQTKPTAPTLPTNYIPRGWKAVTLTIDDNDLPKEPINNGSKVIIELRYKGDGFITTTKLRGVKVLAISSIDGQKRITLLVDPKQNELIRQKRFHITICKQEQNANGEILSFKR